MISVGEKERLLEELLSKAARLIRGRRGDDRGGSHIHTRPVMIVIMGGIVGFVVISISCHARDENHRR
jgi:type II secretory pathway component PulF